LQAGGEEGLEDSVLEVPTYVLSIVFFIFLALSVLFELVRGCMLPSRPLLCSALAQQAGRLFNKSPAHCS